MVDALLLRTVSAGVGLNVLGILGCGLIMRQGWAQGYGGSGLIWVLGMLAKLCVKF